MRALVLALILVAVALGVFAIHAQIGAPPDPRLGGCDPNNIPGSQAAELLRLSNWLLWQELLGGVFLAIAAYFLFYLQIFHDWPVPLAWLSRVLVFGVFAAAIGFLLKGVAQSWVANNLDTCLGEATRSDASVHVARVGQIVSLSWPWGVFVDGVALALVGAFAGLLAYAAARQARA
jgi:hypothetical protein